MCLILAFARVSASMNRASLQQSCCPFLVTFIKVSLEWYKTLHVRISLIICVMDHCFIARTELRGVFTRSVSICARHGEWYGWWSGRYDIQKQSFKLMIIICLCGSSRVKVWHFLCEEVRNPEVMPLAWILFDWSCFIRRIRVYLLIFSIIWPHLKHCSISCEACPTHLFHPMSLRR